MILCLQLATFFVLLNIEYFLICIYNHTFFRFSAGPGTYVFEPPGETHTLLVDEDCEEMVTMFHVTGSLLYTNEQNEVIGFDDVFSKVS